MLKSFTDTVKCTGGRYGLLKSTRCRNGTTDKKGKKEKKKLKISYSPHHHSLIPKSTVKGLLIYDL